MKTPEVGKMTVVRERGRNIRVSITLQRLQILYAGDTTTKTEKDCIQRKAGKTVACGHKQQGSIASDSTVYRLISPRKKV